MNKEILFYLKIKATGLSPDEYFYLRLLQAGKLDLSDIDEESVQQSLEQKGVEDLSAAAQQLDGPALDVDKFVEKYRALFPKMMLPSGKSARSTASEVKTKMRWFFANYDYTTEQILKATEAYVNERAEDDYLYMQTASYFIYKDDRSKVRSSALAERCELIGENIDNQNFGIDV